MTPEFAVHGWGTVDLFAKLKAHRTSHNGACKPRNHYSFLPFSIAITISELVIFKDPIVALSLVIAVPLK